MDIILTILLIALLGFTIMKKSYPVATLFTLGVLVLLGYTIITQKSVMGANSIGNIYLDIFEYVKTQFTSAWTVSGLTLMPIVGYATYMNHIGASQMLAQKMIKPFEHTKNPYFLCIVGILLGGLLRIAIPSQTGLVALLMVTFYPVMIGAGMSVLAATSVCVCGTAFDWGPGDANTALSLSTATGQPQGEFFMKFQFPALLCGLIVTAIASYFVNRIADKKHPQAESAKNVERAEEVKLPFFYAFFPLLPLILMIIFSGIVLPITLSAFAATMISVFFVIICETIRHKSVTKSFEGSKQQFLGMGTCFGEMITLIASATIFAGGVRLIGGFAHISNLIIASNMPAVLLIVAVMLLSILMTFVCASNVPALNTFAPFATAIAEAGKIANETVLVPMITAFGMSRSFSPVSAANVFAAKFVGIDTMDLVKRNAIPLSFGLVATLIASIILIG